MTIKQTKLNMNTKRAPELAYQYERYMPTPVSSVQAGDPDSLIPEVRQLIASGSFEAAQQLLESAPHTPETLDLIARLRVQQADWSGAREKWEQSLSISADNQAARDALTRLNSNWLFKALAIRVLQLASLALLLSFFAVGVLYALNLLPDRSPADALVIDYLPHPPRSLPDLPYTSPSDDVSGEIQTASQTAQGPSSTSSLEPQEVLSLTVSVSDSAEPTVKPISYAPLHNIGGIRVSGQNGHLTIGFDDGLFLFRSELAPLAEHILYDVVSALTELPTVSKLLIVGHTDDEPMPSGTPFADNYELGLARAATVASWFRANSTIPQEALVATSVGADNPPFPNTDYDSRLRNRTVQLQLTFADPIAKEDP